MKRNITKTVSDKQIMLSSPRQRRLTETVEMKTVFAVAGLLPFGQPFQYRPTSGTRKVAQHSTVPPGYRVVHQM